MQNNQVGSLNVAVEGRKNTFKDKSSDLHITMDFGSVVCGKCQRVIPDTEFGVGDRERVILTSLVAPCFGRMSLKSYSYFVPMSAVFRNYAAMMAQTPVWRGSNSASFVPSSLPSVPQRSLSYFVLMGAQLTVYQYDPVNHKVTLPVLPSNVPSTAPLGSLPSNMQQVIQDLQIDLAGSSLGFSNAMRLPLARLLGWSANSAHLYLSNLYYSTIFDARSNHPDDTIPSMDPIDLQNGYDKVVPVSVEYTSGSFRHYYLAFKLSSFGRRLMKNLIGSGWQFNFASDKYVSVLPLFATYLAYFEIFGIDRFTKWEETYAYRLIQLCDVNSSFSFDPILNTTEHSVFRSFLLQELGLTYYTSPLDFVGAHSRESAISPPVSGLLSTVNVDVDAVNSLNPNIDVSSISGSEHSDLTYSNGHAFINNPVHGHLDSEILKRLYRTTNVNTAAGRRIAELLRAQGLGAYMDENPSRFIGSWDLELSVYDLPSQSDTYNKATDEGMQLGEYGAYGNQNGVHDKVHYKTSEDGWFINLLVVVPKGGYSQTVDPDMFCLTKYEQFNPVYDSVGYEFDSKDETVLGNIDWQQTGVEAPDTSSGSLTDSFGVAPRDFKRKFGRSVINGEFALHSKMHTYSPWNLERLITVNDKRVQNETVNSNGDRQWDIVYLNKPNLVPIAGDAWRYLTRYEWLNRFNRIFYNSYSSFSGMSNINEAERTAMFEYFSLRDDNFIVHMVYDIAVYDKMLPVQDSFETEDDEVKANAKMSKA